jgi:hypothetical protein
MPIYKCIVRLKHLQGMGYLEAKLVCEHIIKIYRNRMGQCGLDSFDLGYGHMAGSCGRR